MTKEPLQPQDKYVLRLPDGMRDRLKEEAANNNRSMNAEIIARLEESFESTIFETAVRQNETLKAQGETLEEQSRALETQSKALEAQSNALKSLRDSLGKLESALATFANIFDEAARGDRTALDLMIERATKKPLPKSTRRSRDDKS